MKRILILFALCTQALAGPVYVYTNDVNTLDRAAHPITMQSGAETRYTITATRSTNALNLTDLVGVWTITDPRDAAQLAAYTGTVLSASRGLIRFTATPPATMERGVTYDGLARLTLGTSVIAQIAYDYVTLAGPACSTCSAGGVSVTFQATTNVTASNVEANSPGYFATGTPIYVVTSNTLSGVDGSGLTNLPSAPGSGAPQSPITNAVNYAGYSAVNMGYALINRMQIGQLSPYSSANTTAWSTVTNSWQGAVGGWIRSGTRGSVLAAGETNYLGANMTDVAIVGGRRNAIDGNYSIIGGGEDHYITAGNDSIIGGGLANTSAAQFATISGGTKNRASGIAATVPGGATNIASGAGSFAAGRNATASGDGSFAWNSVQTNALTNATAQAVWFNAPGGARFYVGGTNYWEFLGTNLYCNGVLKL